MANEQENAALEARVTKYTTEFDAATALAEKQKIAGLILSSRDNSTELLKQKNRSSTSK